MWIFECVLSNRSTIVFRVFCDSPPIACQNVTVVFEEVLLHPTRTANTKAVSVFLFIVLF
jgi:hypothetical protein